jgi:hypothetical protein
VVEADGRDGANTDGFSEDLCQGPAKVKVGGVLYLADAITSEELIMDCCTGAVVVLHLPPPAGTDLAVTLQAFAVALDPGIYTLDGSQDGAGIKAIVRQGTTCCEGESAGVTGALEISRDGSSWEAPTLLTLCGRVDQAGPLQGARLWFERVPVAPVSWWSRWGLWLLKDPALSAYDAAKLPLDSLVLAGEPLVDLGSIAWYGWDTHTLVWGSWHNTTELRNRLPHVGVYGLPFVVFADGERIYLGGFYTMVSSLLLDMPTITIDDPGISDDRLTIEPRPSGLPGADLRSDPRIQTALREAAKLAP